MSFRFKQFVINDDRCAMKVGTDGVLIGSWIAKDYEKLKPCKILDVGTGSGLIALMLAQRFPKATIKGVDIDARATKQANENFALSDWSDRLEAQCVRLQDMNDELYDMLVSNPPFFNAGPDARNTERTMARRTDCLTLEELVTCGVKLLREGGLFSLILPACQKEQMLLLSKLRGLSVRRMLYVRGRVGKPVKRILFEFVKGDYPNNTIDEELILEDNLSCRSAEYAKLMEDFYL